MEREGTEVIRILLVDDVEKIRESLRSILATYPPISKLSARHVMAKRPCWRWHSLSPRWL